VDQAVDRLRPGLGITPIAELPSVRPKPVAELAFLDTEMRAWLRTADRQPLKGDPGRSLRLPPRNFDRFLQAATKF
jgi:hypothetical protein